MTEAVEKRINDEIKSFRRRILYTGILIVASLVTLLAAWFWCIVDYQQAP